MKTITSPNESYSLETNNYSKIFLAGSISDCPDWQSEFLDGLDRHVSAYEFTIYNPRRKNFKMVAGAEEEQIVWEYQHLKNADIIVFWFCKESLGPIVLYELGRWANSSNKKIFIGVEPGYKRKNDVVIQTKLSRPEIEVVDDLDVLRGLVEDFIVNRKELEVNV